MSIETIGIIGAGTMGNGIAQIAAQSGLRVVMLDVNAAAIERGMKAITGSLERLVRKEKISAADRDAALERVVAVTDPNDLKAADYCIEAATENEPVKMKILADADRILKPDAVIATNTSSISITKLATATKRPERFIGMHFFNPVPLMALVELIRGLQTSDATLATAHELTRRLGKSPITVKNSPGFVVNRVLCPMINEAIFAYAEGLASAEEIDSGMKLGCNHPIGPLALADMIGARRDARRDERVLRRLQRPEVPAGAVAERDGRCGISRPQDRPRLLRLRVAGPAHRGSGRWNHQDPLDPRGGCEPRFDAAAYAGDVAHLAAPPWLMLSVQVQLRRRIREDACRPVRALPTPRGVEPDVTEQIDHHRCRMRCGVAKRRICQSPGIAARIAT
jgi:3-hydroxybutyryl-CoA dehydrogenase